MVSIGGGDQRDVLVHRGAQSTLLGLATANVDVVVEATGIGPTGAPGLGVLLIEQGAAVPPDTPVGTVIFEKGS